MASLKEKLNLIKEYSGVYFSRS